MKGELSSLKRTNVLHGHTAAVQALLVCRQFLISAGKDLTIKASAAPRAAAR
jgi:hypothetical protein